MSNTLKLENVVENLSLSLYGKNRYEYESLDLMIDSVSIDMLGMYPIFDENYRLELNRKIIRHYFLRELCVNNYARWKFFIQTDLYEKMPYFNQLYETQLIEFDLFDNMDLTTTMDRDLTSSQDHTNKRDETTTDSKDEISNRKLEDTLSSTNNQTGLVDGETKQIYEDTPYSKIQNYDYATNLTTDKEKTNSTVDSKGEQKQNQDMENTLKTDNINLFESESVNTTKGNNTEDYVKRIFGKTGTRSKADLLMEFRRSIINVDEEVIKSLEDNFYGYYR